MNRPDARHHSPWESSRSVFRLTYVFTKLQEITLPFEMASPDKPEQFRKLIEGGITEGLGEGGDQRLEDRKQARRLHARTQTNRFALQLLL